MQLSELLPPEKIRELPASDWRHKILFDQWPGVEGMRGCVNRLLDFAERQKIIDSEMLSRLGGEDYKQFLSAIHEIAIAEFLSPLGSITWYPLGRDSRKGEFRITPANYESIFVEVKTMFLSPEEQKRDTNWDVLRNIAHKVPSPFRINIEFLKLQHDLTPRRFSSWLRRQIDLLKRELTSPNQERALIFSETFDDGIIAEVQVTFVRMQNDDLPITACDMTSGNNQIDLRERVVQVVDGALEQLPDNQPTLVVIASEPWVGLGEIEMIAAMFSYTKVAYKFYKTSIPTENEAPIIYYSLQGIVQQSIRKRLSAVGVWHHKWTKNPEGALDIYHNPLAARQIPYNVLELPHVCQLVPKNKDSLVWIPDRPHH